MSSRSGSVMVMEKAAVSSGRHSPHAAALLALPLCAALAGCPPGGPPPDGTCALSLTPQVLPEHSVPRIEPGTCVDRTPKVALIVALTLPNEVFGGLGVNPFDRMLLYVPAADADGKRVLELDGAPGCVPDPCPAQVREGRPTEEKCPPPRPDSCATQLPGLDRAIASLSNGTVTTKNASGAAEALAYVGVVVVANEIRIGPGVTTNGRPLALLAERIVGKPGAGVSTAPLRAPASEAGGRPGGGLVLLAERIEGSPIGLAANGGPGPLPRSSIETSGGATLGIHWDCPDYTATSALDSDATEPLVNPVCFGCARLKTAPRPGANDVPGYLLDPQSTQDPGQLRCLTGIRRAIANTTACGVTRDRLVDFNLFSYPQRPAAFPPSFTVRAPSGHPGGAPGPITVLAGETATRVTSVRSPGRGSRGLGAYTLQRYPVSSGTDCFSADDSTTWRVPEGEDFSSTGSIMIAVRAAGTATSFPGAPGRVRAILEEVSDELITADQLVVQADEAFRTGDRTAARSLYQRALDALGTWAPTRACSRKNRFEALQKHASGALTKLDSGLDFAGFGPADAPFESDAALETQVDAAITAVATEATRIQLMALLTLASAQHEAKLAEYAAEADGDLAERESAVNTHAQLELKERLAESLTQAKAADQKVTYLRARLETFYAAKLATTDLGATIEKVVKTGAELAGALVKLGMSTVTAENLFGAVKSGVEAGKAVSELATMLDKPSFDCSADTTCVTYLAELQQARIQIDAASRAVAAAQSAFARQKAEQELFEARRASSRDLERILRGGNLVVPIERTARAVKYLCEYGGQLADDAAKALHRFKRASALRNVPTTAQNAALYGGKGGTYSYSFQPLFAGTCQTTGCSLRDDFNAFRQARLAHIPANTATLHAGTDVPAEAERAAAMLRAVPLSPGGRAELELGLVDVGGAMKLALRPPRTAGPTQPVIDGASFADKWAVQVLSIRVRLIGPAGPVRDTLPVRVSRPSSDEFETELATTPRLGFTMAAYPGLVTDQGQLLDELRWNAGTGSFELDVAGLPSPRPVLQHPESLLKPWTIWLPICATAGQGGCATADEVLGISSVQVQVSVRYKAR